LKKLVFIILAGSIASSYADISGWYVGGGLGAGFQNQSYQAQEQSNLSPALRAHVGYQFAGWVDAELGWNYITQSDTQANLGNSSSTIYDFAFLPGFTLPATPLTIFVRLGIDAVSTNLNSSWYNQLLSNSRANFEYGAGVKVSIPLTRTWIRAEYINYGGMTNNNNSNLITTPSALLINAAYVF
jgi:hypothetical protein